MASRNLRPSQIFYFLPSLLLARIYNRDVCVLSAPPLHTKSVVCRTGVDLVPILFPRRVPLAIYIFPRDVSPSRVCISTFDLAASRQLRRKEGKKAPIRFCCLDGRAREGRNVRCLLPSFFSLLQKKTKCKKGFSVSSFPVEGQMEKSVLTTLNEGKSACECGLHDRTTNESCFCTQGREGTTSKPTRKLVRLSFFFFLSFLFSD